MIYFWSIFVSLIHSFIYFIYFFCLRDCTLIFFEMRFWPLVIVVSVPSMHMHMHIYIACVYLTSEVPFRSFSASLPRSITAARLPTTLYAFDPIQHNTQHKACYSIINNLQLSLTWNLIIATENETNELIVDDFFFCWFCFVLFSNLSLSVYEMWYVYFWLYENGNCTSNQWTEQSRWPRQFVTGCKIFGMSNQFYAHSFLSHKHTQNTTSERMHRKWEWKTKKKPPPNLRSMKCSFILNGLSFISMT